ncbi:hypothetical protein JN080_20595 [Bacillus sp. EB600]|nr:hypothetical protein [Bacillus sp. EB600]
MTYMDKKKIFSLAMLIAPWLTVPFMGKKPFFRFLPVASFVNLFLSIFSVIANKKRWWKNKNPLYSGVPIDFSFILGPFFVTTLWVFKLTYGSFLKYLITNAVLDAICAFPFYAINKKVGIFEFKKMTRSIWFFICVSLAIIIYGYQYIVEQTIKKANNSQSEL